MTMPAARCGDGLGLAGRNAEEVHGPRTHPGSRRREGGHERARRARDWQTGPLPSETRAPRDWRTRADPFEGVWETLVEPLLRADTDRQLEAPTRV